MQRAAAKEEATAALTALAEEAEKLEEHTFTGYLRSLGREHAFTGAMAEGRRLVADFDPPLL